MNGLTRALRRAGHRLWVAEQEAAAMRFGDLAALRAIHREEHGHGHLQNVTTWHEGRPHEMTPAECDPLGMVTLTDVPWGERRQA